MCDVKVIDHGTIVQLVPMTEAAREFLDTELATEPWQWVGMALCIDHSHADDVIEYLTKAGFQCVKDEA